MSPLNHQISWIIDFFLFFFHAIPQNTCEHHGIGSGLNCSLKLVPWWERKTFFLENRQLHGWPWWGLPPSKSQRNHEFCPDSALDKNIVWENHLESLSFSISSALSLLWKSVLRTSDSPLTWILPEIIHQNIFISILFIIYEVKNSASLKETFHHNFWVTGSVSTGASDVVFCHFMSIGRKSGFRKGTGGHYWDGDQWRSVAWCVGEETGQLGWDPH